MGAQGWLVGGWAAAGPSNAVEGERALMLKWGSVPQQLCWSHWRLFLPLWPFPGLWKTRVSSSWKGRSLGFEVTASQRSAWHLSPLWACTSHTSGALQCQDLGTQSLLTPLWHFLGNIPFQNSASAISYTNRVFRAPQMVSLLFSHHSHLFREGEKSLRGCAYNISP